MAIRRLFHFQLHCSSSSQSIASSLSLPPFCTSPLTFHTSLYLFSFRFFLFSSSLSFVSFSRSQAPLSLSLPSVSNNTNISICLFLPRAPFHSLPIYLVCLELCLALPPGRMCLVCVPGLLDPLGLRQQHCVLLS